MLCFIEQLLVRWLRGSRRKSLLQNLELRDITDRFSACVENQGLFLNVSVDLIVNVNVNMITFEFRFKFTIKSTLRSR